MSTIKSSAENLTLNADGAGNDIKFQSNASEVAEITDGGVISSTGGSTHADNVKAKFGTGNDLEIYHDGSNSFIDDSGNGVLQIRSNDIYLQKYTGETMINCIADGAVSLYFNNAVKLATTLKGVQATGTMAVGATPLELYSGYSGFQVGSNGFIFGQHAAGADKNLWLSQNSWADGTGNEVAISTGTSSSIHQASGNIYFRTAASVSANANVTNQNSLHLDAGNVANFRRYDVTTSGYETLLRFKDGNNNERGTIKCNNSSTQYNTSSDYRLKENINYTWDATTRLKQLKPCRFNFIEDDTNTLVDGFIAHEAQTIVPEAVSGTKDAMVDRNTFDSSGNVSGTENVIDPQGIDQSKFVPLLVKTIQELEARITALEA
jgi:hypothetical protein